MTLTIRRSQPSDAAHFVRVMGEPEVLANLLQVPYPGEAQWRTRLEANAAPGSTDMILVAQSGDEVVGHVGLHAGGTSPRRRHAASLGIAVVPAAQGQGVGKALMQAVTDYADNWAHLLRLELTAFTDNLRAIQLYRRFGFEQEGVLRAYALRNGQYADVVTMARLHPKPPQLPDRQNGG